METDEFWQDFLNSVSKDDHNEFATPSLQQGSYSHNDNFTPLLLGDVGPKPTPPVNGNGKKLKHRPRILSKRY